MIDSTIKAHGLMPKYIDEGNELLSKNLDKNEKKLVNLAINSIKSSQSF